MDGATLRVVLCNCSPDESSSLAELLVEEKLAACVNVISGIQSFYVWQGEMCRDEEDTLLIKTTDERFEEMRERLVEAHSYDVPEVISLEGRDVYEPYVEWAHQQTS